MEPGKSVERSVSHSTGSNYRHHSGTSELLPRTEHEISLLALKVSSPLSTLPQPLPPTQKEIRNRLFAADDGTKLPDHSSDWEAESDPEINLADSTESLSSYMDMSDKKEFRGLSIRLVDQDHSLTRSLAKAIYGSQAKYNLIEDDIMRHEFDTKTESTFNFARVRQSQIRPILQAVANHHAMSIEWKRATAAERSEIVSPQLSQSLSPRPLAILQLQPDVFAALERKRNHVRDEVITERSHGLLGDQIIQSFIQGQKWTAEDARRHQLIIQGPASIEESSLEPQDEAVVLNVLKNSSSEELPTTEDRSALSKDRLLQRIAHNYSPVLGRRQMAPHGSRPSADSARQLKPRQASCDSFDFDLNLALDQSRREAAL
ncbi:hypothetical protein HDU91_005046 [Kappamyces sp. JEL0680]|nr:hypothetical protein HDU91_005046 [Kappamyces sp. JEL0680]